ncbi:ABC-type transport system involved in multi-copper enzyme maturation, permease component [Singulisphaera sp. GP187]|uniref:ABC transporter permease subunit n=1 Tax=Singulisphaera sp. GP187 TaxID=1882752 RepID=UPI00092A17D2|nr:ABC transporter permease subunit [Singulisphaera sp. GP187]SIN73277.1 ABC-type transport system involved in multi-copper enzyme maturation, permease component [Singulisphaera sp. GP187]
MRMRVGLGPVFAYEWLATSRRWQVYAVRSLFVAVLLASLALVWRANVANQKRVTIQSQAEAGRSIYDTIVGTQLILLLLAAPAATAGSICLDKARGTLTHLLMTDLSNAEIVLGKLAARLVPVLGLVASALPALALVSLMGGVDPDALTGAFLVSLGVATLGCTLAFLLSVWGTKTHEVLMATYAILLVWILGSPTWSLLNWALRWRFGPPPQWLNGVNPFWLAFSSSWQRGAVDLGPRVLFLAVSCGISAGLTALAVLRIRAVASRQAGHAPGRRRGLFASGQGRRRRDGFGPRLDFNPVLWREWHRRRPSRWSRILGTLYHGAAIALSLMMVYIIIGGNSTQCQAVAFLNGGQVAVGFLLLSIASSTSMTEERVRGSLDVVLATPMSTRAIVLGKWWGAYQGTLFLAILPGIVTFAIACRYGHWVAVPLVVGLILSFGAALTSLGLALATWIQRQGQVMALTVTAYVLVTIGWPLLAELLGMATSGSLALGIGSASPWLGTVAPNLLVQISNNDWPEYAAWLFVWCIVDSLLAVSLLAATLGTFDRCLGRGTTKFAATPPRPKPALKLEPAALLD